jgi:glycosyltransferase involved in cell wall biosynthesis
MSIKILYLIKTMDVGGAERFTFNLSTYMQKQGNDVSIYSSGGIFISELRDKNVGYIYSENANKIGLKGFFKIRQEIKEILSKKKYNIIHCQHRIFVPILSTLSTGNSKIIYTANNYFDDFLQNFIWPQYAVAISPSIKINLEKTLRIKKDSINCINLGVQMPSLVPWGKRDYQTDNITIGFVGRLIKEKGIMNLLEAFKNLSQPHPEARLKIIGDGPYKFALMNFISDNSLDEIVDFSAPLTDPDAIYKNIDILMLPSQMKEGLPISILEAMARGILIITTSSGAIKDLVVNKETVFIMEKGDAREIFGTLNDILSNYPNLEKLIKNSRKIVLENYSLDNMLNEYEEFYHSILEK